MELEVFIQCLQVFAVRVWLPCGVAQVPVNKELDRVAHPSMGGYFIDEPFGVIRVAHVIEGLGIPLWKELIIIGLMLSQEVDMEGRVYPLIPELLGQLDRIVIHFQIARDDLHRSNVFRQELSSSSFRQGKVLC